MIRSKNHCLLAILLLVCSVASAQAPLANFTASQVEGCTPLVISFQDQSTGNPTTWDWDFGNGRGSNLQNPSATYFFPGTYTVKLTVSNGSGGNTLTRTAYVTVYDKPKVDFAASGTTGCYPFLVQFADSSVASPGTTNVAWQWNFGNGLESTQQSPRFTYTQAGNYPVTLKVTNDKGCFGIISKPAYISVPTGVKVSFDQANTDRCQAPMPVTFNSTSTGPGVLTYQWDFGDGTGSDQKTVSHTYVTQGAFSVTLKVTSSDGCSDSLRKSSAVVTQSITTNFSAPTSICSREPATFTNASAPVAQSSTWNFGDGTSANTINAVKVFNTPGTYTVRLLNTYGTCKDTVSKTIEVLPRSIASFTANQTFFCQPPAVVSFKEASAGAVQWFWTFGDGQTSNEQNPVHTYTSFGDFNVVLVVTNASGCTDTLRRPAYIKVQKPVIVFSTLPQNGCIPYVANMTASITSVDNITSYAWDFGDGSAPSSAVSPSHTYTQQGSYPVTLTITTSTGCTETMVMNNAILVGRQPVVDFTASPNPVCAYQPVNFQGTASEGNEWLWSFGDQRTSTEQNPVHTYTQNNSFSVSLTVTNSGCSETVQKTDYLVVKPPIAKFDIKNNCSSPKEFTFTNTSSGPVSWVWDFGDGTTSQQLSPNHTFPDFGTYPVKLTVTNGACTHTTTRNLIVHDEVPSFKADTTEACKTVNMKYTALVQRSDFFASYNWDFGNGATGTGATPLTLYGTAGTFSTQLIATDIYGCKDTIRKENYMRINGPTANFTAANTRGCKGITVQFKDQSVSDGVNPITTWIWKYGDGQSETAADNSDKQHTYLNASNYTVQLNLMDAKGCRDSIRFVNLVTTTAPIAKFTPSDTLTCLGSLTRFTNTTTSSQSYTSVWDFGDGITSDLANPTHIYKDTGTYSIRLITKDALGCVDSIIKPAYITVKKTTAAFSLSDSVGNCIPFDLSLTNNSTFYTKLLWDFGNGTGTDTNPTRTYIVPGNYTVVLVATGRGGCTDTARKPLLVNPNREVKFSYSPTEACQTVFLKASVEGSPGLTYAWDFGDGTLVTTTNEDTSHLYTILGDYLPRLIVTDSANCVIPFIGTDTVRVKGVNTGFTLDRRLLCDSGLIQFTDTSRATEPVINYFWSFGDGGSSTLQSPAYQYQRPGLYTVSLVAQTASLCRDTTTIQALVKVVQSPSITINSDTVICKDASILHAGVLLRPDTSSIKWAWQFPNGNTATVMRPPAQRYTVPGKFEIRTVAINSSGCTDTAVRNLEVYPLPSISVPAVLTSPVGTPITIQPTNYSANVVSYTWSPAEGLSCTACPQPIAQPKNNTTYQIRVTDANGCRNTAEVQVVVFCPNSNVFIPNTFSPNGDGSNDVFIVRGTGLERVKNMRIFNRWGEILFQKKDFAVNDLSTGWDGTYKGKPLPPDTYIYQVEVFCENNEAVRFDGSLTLIR